MSKYSEELSKRIKYEERMSNLYALTCLLAIFIIVGLALYGAMRVVMG